MKIITCTKDNTNKYIGHEPAFFSQDIDLTNKHGSLHCGESTNAKLAYTFLEFKK